MELEILREKYRDLVEGTIKSNTFPKWCKNRKDLYDRLMAETVVINGLYPEAGILQRMHYLFSDKKINLCECGSPRGWRNLKKGYNKTCGNLECSTKCNVESVKNFYLENYGVTHLFATQRFQDDFKKASIEKYGVDNPGKSQEVIEKARKTNIERFGETSWLKVKKNRDYLSERITESNSKKRSDLIEKHSIPIEVLKTGYGDEHALIYCKECNQESSFSASFFSKNISAGINPCLTCNPRLISESKSEIEVYDYIRDIYPGEIIKNYRDTSIGKKEIDIFLPALNIAFEFDGVYWHSEIFKGKMGNILKKDFLKSKGISVYNIWEDDWVLKKDIMKSRISSAISNGGRIYARKCTVSLVSSQDEREFLVSNHIQGYVPSKIKIGLYYENNLVSIMTFGSRRKVLGQNSESGKYEMLRFCNKLNTQVIGGASKLFSHFVTNHNFRSVTSYQDNDWHAGNLYENLGFEMIETPKPNYYWCKGNIRFHRFNFRKDKLVSEEWDPNLSESDIMTARGYYKLWDYGNYKWEYKNKGLDQI